MAVTPFEQAFAVLLGNEGGFTRDPKDRGNWTSGKVGTGRLVGTRWGISAAAYPTLDIPNLTQAQAAGIYQVSYWAAAGCNRMPYPLALLAFDASVNHGPRRAIMLLQQALGVTADGLLGPVTSLALRTKLGNGSPDRVLALCGEFQARRLVFMVGIATWPTYGLGWARRLCRMAGLAGSLNATAARAA